MRERIFEQLSKLVNRFSLRRNPVLDQGHHEGSRTSVNCVHVRWEQAYSGQILRTWHVPQCEVVFVEELRLTCLSLCQRSRTRFEIAKAFVVGVYVYLLWSSKETGCRGPFRWR